MTDFVSSELLNLNKSTGTISLPAAERITGEWTHALTHLAGSGGNYAVDGDTVLVGLRPRASCTADAARDAGFCRSTASSVTLHRRHCPLVSK